MVNKLKETLSRILITTRIEQNGAQLSVEYLMKVLSSPTVPDDVRKHLAKDVAIYEVGNGDVSGMIQKLFNFNDKFLVSTGGDVTSFITSIGR